MEKQSTKINKKDFIEKFGDYAVYAAPYQAKTRKGHYFPYFYLHGNAESRNGGYDICNASPKLMARSLRQGANLCVVHYRNGNKVPAICFSKFELHSMKGLICLLSDKLAIYNAVHEYLEYLNTPSMCCSEEDYLRKHGIFKFMLVHDKLDPRYLELLDTVEKLMKDNGYSEYRLNQIEEKRLEHMKAKEESRIRVEKMLEAMRARKANQNQ